MSAPGSPADESSALSAPDETPTQRLTRENQELRVAIEDLRNLITQSLIRGGSGGQADGREESPARFGTPGAARAGPAAGRDEGVSSGRSGVPQTPDPRGLTGRVTGALGQDPEAGTAAWWENTDFAAPSVDFIY